MKALVDIYGGNIEVKDRVEGVREWGTNFIVDFPVVNVEEGGIGIEETTAEGSGEFVD